MPDTEKTLNKGVQLFEESHISASLHHYQLPTAHFLWLLQPSPWPKVFKLVLEEAIGYKQPQSPLILICFLALPMDGAPQIAPRIGTFPNASIPCFPALVCFALFSLWLVPLQELN